MVVRTAPQLWVFIYRTQYARAAALCTSSEGSQ